MTLVKVQASVSAVCALAGMLFVALWAGSVTLALTLARRPRKACHEWCACRRGGQTPAPFGQADSVDVDGG
ncbi:hypothetical protein ACFRI7_05885 [Streptomyces sp. NPDC056716]|uniref:hypothetical protein n=1 Tax=Streptomyces sp. NPDC056716 TaxID=3345922 RepID=UPI0036B82CB9